MRGAQVGNLRYGMVIWRDMGRSAVDLCS